MTIDDMELLGRYARTKSEDAFATLVSRHVNLVYSVAMRQVRDPHLAEEITQSVFFILAKKAGSLSSKTILSGWLCQTARFCSAKARTAQMRREKREHEAYMQSTSQSNESDDAAWIQIAPLLDDAMTGLGQKDHDALVCRYFEGRSFTEVASQLGTTEAGAKMRVNRGLEKLRKFFSARGVRFSAWAIAGAMSAHSVQAASNTLAAQVTSAALQGTFVTTTTSTLVEKTLNYMTWIKIKSATALAVAGMLAVGTTGVIVQQSRAAATVSAQAGSVSYATPEATLNSLIAAMKASDTKLFAAGCTKSKAEQFNRQNAGKTKEQLENESSAMAKAFSVYEILRKTAVSDTVVLLHVNAKGKSPNAPAGDRNLAMRMVKVGKDWKFDGEQQ